MFLGTLTLSLDSMFVKVKYHLEIYHYQDFFFIIKPQILWEASEGICFILLSAVTSHVC